MGHTAEAKCRDCGKDFTFDQGGGFFFHLLRCDQCGNTKSVIIYKYGIPYKRDLKQPSRPYCIATQYHHKYNRDHPDFMPLSDEEYRRGIEAIAGPCGCGGNYTFDAPVRCPECGSMSIDEGEDIEYYD